jgi:hypothetical protein
VRVPRGGEPQDRVDPEPHERGGEHPDPRQRRETNGDLHQAIGSREDRACSRTRISGGGRRPGGEAGELGPDVVAPTGRRKLGSRNFCMPAKTNVTPRGPEIPIDQGISVQPSEKLGASGSVGSFRVRPRRVASGSQRCLRASGPVRMFRDIRRAGFERRSEDGRESRLIASSASWAATMAREHPGDRRTTGGSQT